MGLPAISRLVYHGYNLFNSGKLNTYYKAVKKANNDQGVFNSNDIKNYLLKWGFNPDIVQNPLMNKDEVKEWVRKVPVEKIKDWAYTGGSYGEPLKIPYSKQRSLIRTATFKYFNEQGGHKVGNPFVIIRAKKRSSLTKFLRNEIIFIPGDLSEQKLKDLFNILHSNRIKLLMGYPSVIYELALFLERNPGYKNELVLESIITVSEPLDDFKKKVIYDNFGCLYIDRYSNEEVGLIAQQREFGGDYYVNKYGVYVEVVDPKTNIPVKEGGTGKVVVTDIFNDLIPVIRYDTGDLAVVSKNKEDQLLSIKGIIGRTSEQIFTTQSRPVSSLMLGPYIYKPLSDVGQVNQFQFAQVGIKSYQLRIKAGKDTLSDSVVKEIKKGLHQALGNDASIDVIYLNDIEPLPSGKRPIYKNEYHEQ